MKKQIKMKLVAMTLLLLTSIFVVVSASYAWLTISSSTAVSGIQITLSSGNYILIAPDVTTTVDGITYHYPGGFSANLNYAQYDGYDYLQTLGRLSPVSTADGIHWYYPTCYDEDDEAVLKGLASAGELRPFADFPLDNSLLYANQSADSEQLSKGHYIYLDFWVVAPDADYVLRISGGKDGDTYAIDLLDWRTSSKTFSGYTLNNNGITSTSTSVRVGFLASSEYVTDDSYLHYYNSNTYDSRYTSLKGVYAEPGEAPDNLENFRFMIYEPNADSHPTEKAPKGSFKATYPLANVSGVATPVDVRNITAVQMTNWWSEAANGSDLLIEQMFQTALYENKDYAAATAAFYSDYLQAQLSPYIDRGNFIKNSSALGNAVSAERLQTIEKGSATEDVYIIKLERNIPQRIRMYIWLEGQDIDWNPSTAANDFAIGIELAGGTN